jgi:hypothetical protein
VPLNITLFSINQYCVQIYFRAWCFSDYIIQWYLEMVYWIITDLLPVTCLKLIQLETQLGAIVVLIEWQLDLQLHLYLYAISAYIDHHKSCESECHSLMTTLCDKVCQWLCLWFFWGTPVSSTNKTDRHYITEILLKVMLNIIILLKHNYLFTKN